MKEVSEVVVDGGHKWFFYTSAIVQILLLIFLIYIAYRVISKYLKS